MSDFETAMNEAVQWLNIPGVETIIPSHDDEAIIVLISSSTLLISAFIPERFKGFPVSFYYVHGLKVNGNLKQLKPH